MESGPLFEFAAPISVQGLRPGLIAAAIFKIAWRREAPAFALARPSVVEAAPMATFAAKLAHASALLASSRARLISAIFSFDPPLSGCERAAADR